MKNMSKLRLILILASVPIALIVGIKEHNFGVGFFVFVAMLTVAAWK
jgi:hypothetical protein